MDTNLVFPLRNLKSVALVHISSLDRSFDTEFIK